MHRLIPVFFALFAAGSFTTEVRGDEARIGHAQGEWALGGYDPVSYFATGRPGHGSRDLALKWRGMIWQFESAEHRSLFEANPAAYRPRFGGYCVISIAEGQPMPGDPTIFLIRDGRLYLLQSAEDRDRFESDDGAILAAAERQWRALTAN